MREYIPDLTQNVSIETIIILLFFLLVSIVNGMGNATYDIYIILRLKQLNASYVLIGFTAGLGSLTNFALNMVRTMLVMTLHAFSGGIFCAMSRCSRMYIISPPRLITVTGIAKSDILLSR